MEEQFYIGKEVVYIDSPYPIVMVFKIVDFNVYVKDGEIMVFVEIQPIKDYPHPDGGTYLQGHTSEENVLKLKLWNA